MLPIADGSDLGGSLRNPASFCNVVGLRPSPGLVTNGPVGDAWDPMSVSGPMARSVEDLALLLDAMAVPDPRAPMSLASPEGSYRDGLEEDVRGLRIAWSADLGGLPVEAQVAEVVGAARSVFEDLGCEVQDAEPDPLRIAQAISARSEIVLRTLAFFERFDALVLPVSQVVPFPVEDDWVREIAGVPMEHYVAWQRICSRITVTAHPAISLPGGFTAGGLPVGIQIVGRYRDEPDLLRLARAFEAATGFGRERPSL